MVNSNVLCVICSERKIESNSKYIVCLSCGHHYNPSLSPSFMINESAGAEKVYTPSLQEKILILFSRVFLRKFGTRLVDFGSSLGRYAFFVKKYFTTTYGIEVSPVPHDYSIKNYRLDVYKSIHELDQFYDVVTFWHSLEHLNINTLNNTLESIRKNIQPSGCIFVSVPNCKSLQYELFKSNWAYFDFTNHYHQFSLKSLDYLMLGHGFRRIRLIPIFTYYGFGYLQSFLNCFIKPHNYFYFVQKRASLDFSRCKIIASYFLLVFFFPLSILLTLIDIIFQEKSAVINAIYIKE